MTENAPKFKQISAEIEKKIRDGLYEVHKNYLQNTI